jgi:error-prone DNA polymerase
LAYLSREAYLKTSRETYLLSILMYLNCHSHFSFKYGSLSVGDLIAEAKKHKLDALALTDINSTAGVFPFIREAQKKGIHPVIGIDFRNGIQQQYIGLAQNQEGFLCAEPPPFPSHTPIKAFPFDRAPAMDHSFSFIPFPKSIFPFGKTSTSAASFPTQKAEIFPLGIAKDRLVLLQPVSFSGKTDIQCPPLTPLHGRQHPLEQTTA